MSLTMQRQTVRGGRDSADATETTDLSDDELLELLDAEYTRAVMESIRGDPKPAREIAEECGASRPTVYRRLEALVDAGLVDSTMTYDPDGHHRAVFETTLESISVELDADGVSVSVSTEDPEPASERVVPAFAD